MMTSLLCGIWTALFDYKRGDRFGSRAARKAGWRRTTMRNLNMCVCVVFVCVCTCLDACIVLY
jgi:hypothetical protein